jgi:ferric-dicitrate binding protein FerR (iron transport regulator)
MLVAETQHEPMEFALSDGSVVFLNANSKLEYPEEFSGDRRNVTLSGEAFFEIERDTTRQFRIDAGGSLVTVLGTSFNVKIGAEKVEVVVETGLVRLEHFTQHGPNLQLGAGEKGIYLRGDKHVEPSVQVEADYLFWKNRKLNFNETSLSQVVADLNENYGTELSLSSPVMNDCKVSATFENQDVEEVLEVLISTFDMKLDTVENRLILSGIGCDNE